MKGKELFIPNWLISLVLTLGILAAMLLNYEGLQTFDLKIYNFLSDLRQREIPSPVVVVEIDQNSIQEIGPWPWPRSYLADAITKVSADGAKAIGITVLNSAPELNPGLDQIRAIRKNLKGDDAYSGTPAFDRADYLLKAAEKKIDHDTMLLEAIKPATVVLPFFLSSENNPGGSTEIPEWLIKNTIPGLEEKMNFQQLLADFKNPFLAFLKSPQASNLITTTSLLAAGAGRMGNISFIPDPDGVIRREQLLLPFQDALMPSLSLQMALAFKDKNITELAILQRRNIRQGLRLADIKIPTSPELEMLIDFENNFIINRHSFSELINGRIPKGALTDKLVLIGLTAPDLTQFFDSPLHEKVTSVDICANTLENIVDRSFVHRAGWTWFMESIILLYFGFIMFFLSSRVKTSITFVILFTFLAAWHGFAYFMFLNNGLWFYVIPQTVLVFTGCAALLLSQYLAAPRKKRDEHTETNKMLGLSFQGQGQLDMAFDSFRKCSLTDPSVKEALYNLALDFERKRMSNKAISVYDYLLKGGKFKDANDRIWRLKRAEAKNLGGGMGARSENTVLMQNSETRPTLGRYEVIKELGKGAIGTVYLGRDPKINRKVAIKTLRYDEIDPAQLSEIKERFFREAEAAGRLSHPNIVTIYDAGEDYDITYMAMEYLDGHDLTRYCKKENLLAPKMIVNIIIRVAFALDYAHKHSVVHRDIKPANIMLTDKGHVKVTDFGIARLTTSDSTQTGVILGTPNYMSPEQVLGKKLDGRSDLFSLGSVFFELLTGEKPFKSDNIGNLMHNIANAKFTPIRNLRPDVPPCCEAIVNRLMTRSRSNRYTNAGEVVIEAQQCLEQLT
ncbi:MAG: CHASE2 domain-containing protein [Proteobacteria bacterium]|nr:CHASE2 domain-containing protein [Pseudomonadota bacterium]MBU1687777.1 CHASE2 domain-containing protein [Pseudomonadota bacterium]